MARFPSINASDWVIAFRQRVTGVKATKPLQINPDHQMCDRKSD